MLFLLIIIIVPILLFADRDTRGCPPGYYRGVRINSDGSYRRVMLPVNSGKRDKENNPNNSTDSGKTNEDELHNFAYAVVVMAAGAIVFFVLYTNFWEIFQKTI